MKHALSDQEVDDLIDVRERILGEMAWLVEQEDVGNHAASDAASKRIAEIVAELSQVKAGTLVMVLAYDLIRAQLEHRDLKEQI